MQLCSSLTCGYRTLKNAKLLQVIIQPPRPLCPSHIRDLTLPPPNMQYGITHHHMYTTTQPHSGVHTRALPFYVVDVNAKDQTSTIAWKSSKAKVYPPRLLHTSLPSTDGNHTTAETVMVRSPVNHTISGDRLITRFEIVMVSPLPFFGAYGSLPTLWNYLSSRSAGLTQQFWKIRVSIIYI